MMSANIRTFLMFFVLYIIFGVGVIGGDEQQFSNTKNIKITDKNDDLETAASGNLFDLGSLFNKYNWKPGYGSSGGGYSGGGGGYYPNTWSSSGGYYPSTYGGSGGYYPSSSGYYPSSGSGGSYYPQGSGYYPQGGTNVLGLGSGGYGGYGGYAGQGNGYYTRGTAGYGGYGGYGGNGGLRSYLGYNDPNYFGRRNLGWGYHLGTNSLGFDRNRYSSEPSYVTGYRGYD